MNRLIRVSAETLCVCVCTCVCIHIYMWCIHVYIFVCAHVYGYTFLCMHAWKPKDSVGYLPGSVRDPVVKHTVEELINLAKLASQ